jgi:hypothetical protein
MPDWERRIEHADAPWPAQKWMWREGETMTAMAARYRIEYQVKYGPGGPLSGDNGDRVGEERSLENAVHLSRFFVAACAWMDQQILVDTPGHVERHRRKQLARESKVRPEVRVIELRRTKQAHRSEPGGDALPVNWSCQWVVDGHWRHQPCGPGRTDRRLIYITPYVKGPEGLPMKTRARKVYQVDR